MDLIMYTYDRGELVRIELAAQVETVDEAERVALDLGLELIHRREERRYVLAADDRRVLLMPLMHAPSDDGEVVATR